MTFPQQPPAPAAGDQFSHVDDFFGGNSKSLHFDADKGYQLGSWKGGPILEIQPKKQQTDAKTKKPLFWDDAQREPKWTLPVVVQTDERDPSDPHDDGKRTAFIDGGKERALRAHLRSTNAKLRPGGALYLAWVSGAGKIGDAKEFQAHYTAPAHQAADAMFAQPAAQQHAAPAPAPAPQAAPPAQQWGQPAAAPAPAGMPPQWAQQAAPAAAPAAPQGGLWGEQPAAPAPQWPATPAAPAAAAPVAGPPTAVAPPSAPQPPAAPAAGGVDPAVIDAAYAHLSPDQRAAIKASGMTPDQIVSVYGPPQQAA